MNAWRWSLLLPLAVSVGIFFVLDPSLLFAPTTPTGGDLGLHVYPYSVGVERILSGQSPAGWDMGWFAGFPLFYFYFPLPAFLAAALTPVFGFQVALKLVVVCGLLALPLVAFLLARWMGLGPVESSTAGAFGGAFVFMESYWHLGGNIFSTVVGEFAYSISFAFAVLFIGLTTRFVARRWPGRDEGVPLDGSGVWKAACVAALVLACTALSHVLTTIMAVVASLPLLFRREGRRFVLCAWVVGFAIAAFWAVPFLVRSPLMGYLRWNIDAGVGAAFPEELWFLFPGAALGIAVVRGLGWRAVPFLTSVLFGLVLFLLPTGLEMRDRLLPFWFFGIHFLTGAALGRGLVDVARRRSVLAPIAVGVIATLAGVLFVVRDVASVRDFSARTFAGYEARDAWPEYSTLMEALDRLAPGRMLWQTDTVVARFGDYGAPALSPYWSPSHPTLAGLLVESSPTAPYARRLVQELSPQAPVGPLRGDGSTEPYDLDRASRRMELFGVRYYAAFTPGAVEQAVAAPGFEERAHTDAFTLFEVPDVQMVTVATRVPTVLEGDFREGADTWFDRDLRFDEWLVDQGPADWPRRSGSPDSWPSSTPIQGGGGSVTDVQVENDVVRFTTSAVGVPHMVKVSWFPNWTAEGADGPWQAAPSLMVVIPRQPEVTLYFRTTWVERMGWALTLLTLVGLATVGWFTRRRRG